MIVGSDRNTLDKWKACSR